MLQSLCILYEPCLVDSVCYVLLVVIDPLWFSQILPPPSSAVFPKLYLMFWGGSVHLLLLTVVGGLSDDD